MKYKKLVKRKLKNNETMILKIKRIIREKKKK